MPPRKSTASNPPDEGGAETTPVSKGKKDDSVGVEDLSLPKSMIARLAKGVLPANTQIQKDALLALHKSATVFVSYIASNSNDLAHIGGKKTISPQDVMSALKDAELEGFLPRLEAELKKYNEVQCDKRNSYRHRVKQKKAAAAADAPPKDGEGEEDAHTNGTAANGHMETDDGAERPAKKLKGPDGVVVTPVETGEDDDVDEGEDGEDDEGDEADEEDEGDERADETMEDVDDEEGEDEERSGLRDEALDDGEESD